MPKDKQWRQTRALLVKFKAHIIFFVLIQLYFIHGPILAAPSAWLPSILQPLPPILSHVTSEAPWVREKGKDKKTCQRCGTIVPCSAYPRAPEKLLMAENWQARLCHLGRHTILYPCSASISRRNKNKEEKDNKDEEKKHFPRHLLCTSHLPKLFACIIPCTAHNNPWVYSSYKLKSLTQGHVILTWFFLSPEPKLLTLMT